jgi:hypothetical protein
MGAVGCPVLTLGTRHLNRAPRDEELGSFGALLELILAVPMLPSQQHIFPERFSVQDRFVSCFHVHNFQQGGFEIVPGVVHSFCADQLGGLVVSPVTGSYVARSS